MKVNDNNPWSHQLQENSSSLNHLVILQSVLLPRLGTSCWFRALRFAIMEENLDLGIYVPFPSPPSPGICSCSHFPLFLSPRTLTIKTIKRLAFNTTQTTEYLFFLGNVNILRADRIKKFPTQTENQSRY